MNVWRWSEYMSLGDTFSTRLLDARSNDANFRQTIPIPTRTQKRVFPIKKLTTNCFSPPGPTVAVLLWGSLSEDSHFHRLPADLEGDNRADVTESVFITDFISCSHKLPGDQILWVRERPFSDKFKGASSSANKIKMLIDKLLLQIGVGGVAISLSR